jgi:hypothetical protein
MWLGLLIATIIMVGFLTTALWIRTYFEEKKISSEFECDLNQEETVNTADCNHCGLKDLTNCSINTLNK